LTRKLIRRILFVGLLLPGIYFGGASATFLFQVHSENGARPATPISAVPAPRPDQRILIFSAHCDDETLGCAGLIQQACRAGSRVNVAMLTNGDGFRVAVERQYRLLRPTPADHIRFAGLRQEEARKALAILGLAPENILFLGYPDRGLMSLWNDNWSPSRPFTSPHTGASRSPYPASYSPEAVYCGQSLLDDIKRLLRAERPTDVYVTHPLDDHPDHAAGSAFVTLALSQIGDEDGGWARRANLRYYLVHRGDWPVPQGIDKDDVLVPPFEMARLDTDWSRRPLTNGHVDRKERAILAYTSQTAIMKRFLLSFARRNELFGELERARVLPAPNGLVMDGRLKDWGREMIAARDPVQDNLLRGFQAGADLRSISACRDQQNLYLGLATAQPGKSTTEYRIKIRAFGKGGKAGAAYQASVRPPSRSVPADLDAGAGPDGVELAIPLRELDYPGSLAVSIETYAAGIPVDKSGIRFLDL
jgi:LmbE family N-acetylglucosaminyl deacetylase